MKLLPVAVTAGVLTLGLAVVELNSGRVSQVLRRTVLTTSRQASRAASVPMGTAPAELPEASGIAKSRMHPGVLWAHNDSGDGPRLYALDSTGLLLHVLELAGVAARDWEDIAIGPCPEMLTDETACLYVADIGDNTHRRPAYAVHIVPEPKTLTPAVGSTDRFETVVFMYGRESYNSEAVAVDDDGSIVVVTKGEEGAASVWELSSDLVERSLQSGGTAVAKRLGVLPLRPLPAFGSLVTGATFDDLGTLVVRTYTALYFYAQTDGRFEAVRPPCVPDTVDLGGEGVETWGRGSFVLIAESVAGRAGVLRRVQCY